MWSDNETTLDYINFTGISETIAEIIMSAGGEPVSIGVSGSWGVGKSSMIRLTRAQIEARSKSENSRKIVFVDFNAWLYQGYDDARAALIDVILSSLKKEASLDESAAKKVGGLLERVNWLRVAKVAAPTAISLLSGGAPIGGMVSGVFEIAKKAYTQGEIEDPEKLVEIATATTKSFASLLDPQKEKSPPAEIQALRNQFEELLEDLEITLVVMVDDLDRCLPKTAIATLESMRLFLFLKHTAFVIAADDKMIRFAVKDHFKDLVDEGGSSDMITNYFDKLIQIPLRVPPLGTQEVRAYMMMLFVENSGIADDKKEHIRSEIANQLANSWRGLNVDREFVKSLYDFDADTIARLDTAQRLAPIMTDADGINGNPRLIKRFLNALALRKSMAQSQNVPVDEAVLAKLLLFERLGSQEIYQALIAEVTASSDGFPKSLGPLENMVREQSAEHTLPEEWQGAVHTAWLKLEPPLAAVDLRGALYIGREHSPILLAAEDLSPKALDLMAALLENPRTAAEFEDDIESLSPLDRSGVFDGVLQKANLEPKWGTPDILDALLSLGAVDQKLAVRVSEFLSSRDPQTIQASIVPKISNFALCKTVYENWQRAEISEPVKKAIEKKMRE